MTHTHHIYKAQGKWHAASLRAMMDELPNGDYTVKLSSASKKTTAQNGYLHVLLEVIAVTLNGMGLGDGRQWTKDRVKQYAKAVEIYPVEDMVLPGGEVIQVAVDTRDLNQLQASETIERLIQHFWEEFEIRLPGPNEQMEIAA